METEFLRPILGDDLYSQVEERLQGAEGVNIANIAGGTYIPKAKYDKLNNRLDVLTSANAELSSQLNVLKQGAAQSETLTARIAELEKETAAKDEQLTSQRRTYLIKDALQGEKTRNKDLVMKLLDMGSITEKDGKLEGLTEQLNKLKETDSYLFETQEPTPSPAANSKGGFQNTPGSGTGGGGINVNEAIRRAAGRR